MRALRDLGELEWTPSRMTFLAAVPIASASASDTWPASSITSVSMAPPSRSSYANSQAVPAKSSTSEPAAANVATSLVLAIMLLV
jgi:hypothetical protein